MGKARKGPSFEERLRELEDLVRQMEEGSVPLEESLELFERGIRLSRDLHALLQEANLRVTKLLEGQEVREAPFEERGGDG